MPLVLEEPLKDDAVELVEELGDLVVGVELVPGARSGFTSFLDEVQFEQDVEVVVDRRTGDAGLPGEFADVEIALALVDEDAEEFRSRRLAEEFDEWSAVGERLALGLFSGHL